MTDPAQYPPPTPAGRSKPKFITGIVLVVIGVLALLGQVSRLGRGESVSGGSGPAFATGQLIGTLVIIVLPIVIGSILIAKSRRTQ